MQRLEVYQSLWSMELRRPDGMEWPLERKFEMCVEAGYDGLCYDTGTDDPAAVRRLKPLYRRHGLKALFTVFPKSVEGLRPMLALAAEFEAPFVTVIGQVMPLRVEEAAPVVRAWLAQSVETGVPILFETHRNCITNDMFFTLLLMEAVPEMRLCADLSHYVVDREFPSPPRAEDEAMIRRILDRADSFQGRVASREQIQLPLAFPQHRKWVALFERWWEYGFRQWRRRNEAEATLRFLCELGPPEYAMTGADGYELSDRWAEALLIKETVRALWARTAAEPA
jgi:hypothetical protein